MDSRKLEEKLKHLVFELRETAASFELTRGYAQMNACDKNSTFSIYETAYSHGMDDAADEVEQFIIQEIISK